MFKKIIWFILLSFYGSLIWWSQYSNFWSIKNTICFFENKPCPDFLQTTCQKLIGQSIILTNLNKLISPTIASINIKLTKIIKSSPSTIICYFDKISDYYILNADQKYFIVNQSGQIFAASETEIEENILIKISPDDLESWQKQGLPTKLHQEFFSLTQLSDKLKSEIESLNYQNHNLIIKTKNNLTAVIDQNFLLNLYKLDLILNQTDFSLFEKPIKLIDLRFKLPVLKTQFDL